MKKLTVILAIILAVLVLERVIFTSSKIDVQTNPHVLRASTSSELTIAVYRVNILGFKTPFSKVYARFEIEEGANLVEITSHAEESATIRSKGIEGEAVIGIYSLKSGALISKVLVKILPRGYA